MDPSCHGNVKSVYQMYRIYLSILSVFGLPKFTHVLSYISQYISIITFLVITTKLYQYLYLYILYQSVQW